MHASLDWEIDGKKLNLTNLIGQKTPSTLCKVSK